MAKLRRIEAARGALWSADWLIENTSFQLRVVSHNFGPVSWAIVPLDDHSPAARAWLDAHQLTDARFRTRREALRVFEAVAAVERPPAPRPLPRLERASEGEYRYPELPELTIKRVRNPLVEEEFGRWMISGAPGSTASVFAATLTAAAVLIADHLEETTARGRGAA